MITAACRQFSNFTMTMTEYDEGQNNNLLIIQYVGDVFVIEINNNIGNWESKKLEPTVNKSLLEPQNTDGFLRINPALTAKANGDVVFVLPMWIISNPAHFELYYYSFSRNYDAIDPLNFEFIPIDYSGSDKIRGMEISPNGYQLYTTQENQTGFQVFNLQNYILGLGNPPTNSITIGSGNFSNSDLFLGRDNKIYCIENLTSSTGLTTINDPNNPSSTTFSSNVFSLSNFKKSLIGSYYDRDAYIFPYQIDQSDYTTGYPVAPYEQPDWSTIGTNETWSPGIGNNPFNSITGIVALNSDFEIPSGKSITLQDMEFHFGDDVLAKVNTNAKLILDNSTLTAERTCDETTMWDGVYLYGNENLDQSYSNQAYFWMKQNSEISNAVKGVEVEGGAMCYLTDGTIEDTRYGVYFHPYTHPTTPSYNYSSVSSIDFLSTSELDNDPHPEYQVFLSGVHGVDVVNCAFDNNMSLTQKADLRGHAIHGVNSDFAVDNCDIDGYYYGIRAFGNSTPDVFDNTIQNTYRGMLLKTPILADIQRNTINTDISFPAPQKELLPGNDPYQYHSYGLYIAGDGISSSIHNVKDNNINDGQIGAIFYNTGENSAEIRSNSFDGIDGVTNAAATLVMGQNSDYDGIDNGDIGLQFRCNQFSTSPYALSVIDGNMRRYQGEQNASSGEDYAGNEFDHYGTASERDF
ncbi:MAG: hypothetical protein ACOC01_01855, partial [Bacteroidales bacterium]